MKHLPLQLKENNSATCRSKTTLSMSGFFLRRYLKEWTRNERPDRSVRNPRSYGGANGEAQLWANIEHDTAELHQSVKWPQDPGMMLCAEADRIKGNDRDARMAQVMKSTGRTSSQRQKRSMLKYRLFSP